MAVVAVCDAVRWRVFYFYFYFYFYLSAVERTEHSHHSSFLCHAEDRSQIYAETRIHFQFASKQMWFWFLSKYMDCSSSSMWRGCIRRLYFVLRPVCEQMTAVSWVGSLKQYTRQRLSFILDGYIGYIGYNYTDITAGMLRAGGQCPARPAQTESAWRRCCSTGPGGEGSCDNYGIIMIFRYY